ncbi:MAG: hypothetical protein JST94_06955 [Bacteroidetes bacterium]|nr:hypothetical protein [Bacteroidota bacterium]MBS1641748.1 hypothetical protein [Bacteroidota bacterium]MBS1671176.1 hypothetical protein [Bacteroidota bacterium]
MKKTLLSLAVISLVMVGIIVSCKKSDDSTPYTCTTCSQTPDAVAANDASSKGIYKGTIIGSSGTIKFDIANNNSTITATLIIDGTTVTLTSTVVPTSSGVYIAPFTGILNGQPISITFSVNSNGSSPSITTSNIPGHPNSVFSIAKETSSALVRCFEGTYHNAGNNEDGTFNILVSTIVKGWVGKSRAKGGSSATDINGTYANNILYWGQGTTTQIATVNGDTFEGTFNDGSGNITVKGKRTL